MPLGYEECDIHVYLDYPQERQSRNGSYVWCTDGTQVNAGSLVDCIIDPVTLSVFGKPLPMTPEWMANVVGPYYRYQINDFVYTLPALSTDYKEQNYKITGNNYLICASADPSKTSSKVYLGVDVKRNEPLFFSFSKLDKKSSSKDPIVKLFWSNQDNTDKDVQLHFTQDGGCDVYRGYKPLFGTITTSTISTTVTGVNTKFMTQFANGDLIFSVYGQLLGQVSTRTTDTQLTLVANATKNFTGSYNKKQPLKVQSYSRTESNYSGGRPTLVTANPNDQYNDVYIIPCRGDSLLVLTSFGLNFCHSFADLNSTFIFPDPPRNINNYIAADANYTRVPIITPEGEFAIQIPEGKVAWQLAKLYFKANWSVESQEITTATVPPVLPYFLENQTISFNNWVNPTTVTGTGTSFLTDLQDTDVLFAQYGGGYSTYLIGSISNIVNDTELTLEEPNQYQATGLSFTYNRRLTGTISFATGDNIINGVGTAFLSELELLDKIYLSDGTYIGQVDAKLSNSQFTIASPTTIGAGSARFYTNFPEYYIQIKNGQYEAFGDLGFDNIPYSVNAPTFDIRTSELQSTGFGGENKKFKLFLEQTSEDESVNYGYMIYSIDYILNTFNQTTPDSTIDIVSALESLNISRSENGEINLSFDARTKLLEDLGVVKPEIISNRPVKVTMKPRRLLLTGLVSKGASDQLIGTDTLFTEELAVDQEIYLENGLFVGNVYSIESDTALTLYGYTAEEFAAEPFSPYKIFSEFIIFEGYTAAPDIDYLQSGPNATTYSEYAKLSFSAIDKKQRLNFEYFDTAPNFDSFSLDESVAAALTISGEAHNNINNIALITSPSIQQYQVPINRNNSNGQYNFSINFGDTAGGFIEKLRSDFAQNFVFFAKSDWKKKQNSQKGFNNFTFFELKDYNYLPSATDPSINNVSLYLNETLAQNDGLIPIYASYKRTIRNLRKTYETPEANRIIIIGLNKSDGSRIQVVLNDEASQNALKLPINRPNNWLGDVYPFVMINDKFNTKSDAEQAANQFFDKITTGREIIEFESDLLTFYDNYTKYVPSSGPTPLSGQIQFNEIETTVYGDSTAFTTELEIGDVLYDNTGRVIGLVYSITDDFELELNANATYTQASFIPFNNYTQVLNEYNYIDIGDIITIYDQDNVASTWQILEWSCDFIREYITPSYATPTVRFAKYRAKKVLLPVEEEFYINPTFVEPAPNQKIIESFQELELRVYAININTPTAIATLTNEPAGMVITGPFSDSIGNYYGITWTPDALDANAIYGQEPYPITFTLSDGTNSKSYQFSVRVYPDTL